MSRVCCSNDSLLSRVTPRYLKLSTISTMPLLMVMGLKVGLKDVLDGGKTSSFVLVTLICRWLSVHHCVIYGKQNLHSQLEKDHQTGGQEQQCHPNIYSKW